MMTSEQYFGAKPHTPEHEAAAADLLMRRNALRAEWAAETGKSCPIDPDTGTEISGSRNGAGDGGFRLDNATTGRVHSSHKEARGVDDYDPANEFDDWLSKYDFAEGRRNLKLEKHDLYREHPSTTITWCHLTTRSPPSGKRTFYP